jgi:hypothetical protein
MTVTIPIPRGLMVAAINAKAASIARTRVCPEPIRLVLPPTSAAEKINTPSILAIDPGTLESGWVVLRDRRVVDSGVNKNQDMLPVIAAWDEAFAIEMIASYGMPVGREVFETCVWIGRFVQAYRYSSLAQLVYRKDVKTHLCGTSQAKDPHIRQALIDLIGPQGVKKAPGPTYGVRSHAWAALGVAATAMKLQREAIAPGLF